MVDSQRSTLMHTSANRDHCDFAEIEAVPLVSAEAVQTLKDLKNTDGQSLFDIQVPRFARKAPEIISSLKSRLLQIDMEAVSQEAHKFKSTCGVVGATRMFAICNKIENLASGRDKAPGHLLPSLLLTRVDLLETCLDDTLEILKEFAP